MAAEAAWVLGMSPDAPQLFEELRFTWEYMAAAMTLLSAQAPARRNATWRCLCVIATFSLASLGYFPFRDTMVREGLPVPVYLAWYLGLTFAMTFSLLWCFKTSLPDLLWTAATAYVAQHVVYVLIHESLALWLWPEIREHLLLYALLSAGCCAIVCFLILRLFASSFCSTGGTILKDEPRSVLTSSLLLTMLFASTFGFQYLFQTEGNRATAVWMDLLVCGLLLGLQYTSNRAIVSARETKAAEQMLEDAAVHWELSHEVIGLLGAFAHDVWHVALGARVSKTPGIGQYLDRVEKELSVIQTTFSSESNALNSVLAPAKVLCSNRGIALECTVGRLDMGAIPITSLYALTNEMVRLSVDVAELQADPRRRAMELGIRVRSGVLLVSCDVACPAACDPWRDGGKLHPLRMLADRETGALRAATEGETASLQVAIPIGK